MRVIDTIAGLRKELDGERAAGRTVGFVPTMGFLHDGHAALMRRARRECDVVAASIFVNPLQFGAGEDLGAYPRDLEGDSAIASDAGVDVLFTPSVDEMYPDGVPRPSGGERRLMATAVHVDVPGVTDVMEGASRPGHFDGVATVVAKLFAIVGPCRAYFGEKDFQQLLVVRRLVADLSLPVDVIGCPTEREDDGLARSSRNVYLEGAQRHAATVLSRALHAGARHVPDLDAACRAMVDVVAAEPLATLDYADALVLSSRTAPEGVGSEVRLLIAARVGRARLIDNLGVRI